MRVWREAGIKVEVDGEVLSFDSGGKADHYFISHAHSDHIIKRKVPSVFCSKETASLIMHRYDKELNFHDDENTKLKVEFLNSGHILGSNSFHITDGQTVLYTGDFTDQDRLFMKKAQLKRADNLILETTFGNPNYSFPNQNEEISRMRDWVGDNLSKSSVMLLGYSLGKGQIISKALEDYPVYTHSSISKINEVYSFLGQEIKTKDFDVDKPPKSNFVYVMPPHLMKGIGGGMKRRFGMKSAVCSGWAINPYYKNIFSCEDSFVMSDHADFEGLVQTVKKVKPQKVYTMHGFSNDFSKYLQKEGYDTEVLE